MGATVALASRLRVGDQSRRADGPALADPWRAPRSALASNRDAHDLPAPARSLLRSQPGKTLDEPVRSALEPRFAADFSAVRIHADAAAAASADAVHARAYTVGQDIVFGAGEYLPSTGRGRELLAHELAHTVQQRDASHRRSPAGTDSTIEARAEAAGRAAANGVAVTQPLPACGIGVSRAPATAANMDDQEIAERLNAVTERLKQAAYPDRESDLGWLRMLQEEAEKRARAKRSALPPRPAAPAPPPLTRDRAIAEAKAVAASIDKELKDDDAAPIVKPAARKNKTSSKFSPGGFSDKDIYAEHDEAKSRLDYELAPAKDPRPFKERLAEANAKAHPTMLRSDYPASVWDYGRENGLFAVHEKNLVMGTINAPMLEERAAQDKRDKIQFAYQQQLRHEKVISDMNVNMIGAFATAPGKGLLLTTARLLATPQRAVMVAQGINVGYRAIAKGDPSGIPDFLISTLPNLYFHGISRTPSGGGFANDEPAPVTSRGGVAKEVSPAQVRQAYKAQPFSLQKSLSDEWHQQQWERNGGTGPAPIAFRAGDIVRVNEVRWLAVGELSEINPPSALKPVRAQVPPGSKANSPDAFAKTGSGDAFAQTMPGADPLADTQNAPAAQPVAVRQTQGTLPRAPAAPAARRGYTPVLPEVAAEAYRINPYSISTSGSSAFHQAVWAHAGGKGPAPIAYRVGDQIRVDLERWPVEQRAAIGLGMSL